MIELRGPSPVARFIYGEEVDERIHNIAANLTFEQQ